MIYHKSQPKNHPKSELDSNLLIDYLLSFTGIYGKLWFCRKTFFLHDNQKEVRLKIFFCESTGGPQAWATREPLPSVITEKPMNM